MANQTLKVFGRFYKKFRDMLDGTHAEIIAVGHSALPAGAATETTLRDLRTRLMALAAAFDGRDLATETTQLTRATEYTLSEAVGLLTAIEGYLLAGIPVEGIAGGEPVGVQQAALGIRSGEIAGTASAVIATQRLPNIACKLVKLKARSDNAGNVYIGRYDAGAALTTPDGNTDVTTGFELAPGEETGWIPTNNLQNFSRKCNNAGDDLTYMALV